MPTTSTSSQLDTNQNTLTDIQHLQDIERKLFLNLETALTNNSLTSDQKQLLINQINEISQMRINLFNHISNINSAYYDNVSSSSNTLGDQMVAIQIVEKELNDAKKRLKMIRDESANKLRLVEINDYYTKKYNFQSKIMKSFIFFCIIIIILTLLARIILPRTIYYLLVTITIIWAVLHIGNLIISANTRNPMNYQEYNWYFDPTTAAAKFANLDASGNDPWALKNFTCIGQACCPNGFTYDSSLNYCMVTENK